MRTFKYSDDKSYKFWNIDLQGSRVTVTYGRIGTQGQTQRKEYADAAQAQAAHDKLVNAKLAKGYVETTPYVGATPTAEVLENAIAADPDDPAAYAAYADWLAEQGDPRGEFMQVQLALEDPARPAKERKALQQREQELLEAHGRDWLGPLAPALLDQEGAPPNYPSGIRPFQFQFARGWLDTVHFPHLTVALARLVARAPQVRLLRRLVVENQAYEEPGAYESGDDIPAEAEEGGVSMYPLATSPYLANVRVFQLGELIDSENMDAYYNCHTYGEMAVALVKKMPRLEELYLLAHRVDTKTLFGLETLEHLRILQVYHSHEYPLTTLARNAALGRLTHLSLHPHALEYDAEGAYINLAGVRAVVGSPQLKSLTHLRLHLSDMGDAGCEEVVRSGILRRLKVLDLRYGCITDAGARTLAASPELRNLESLDLSRNWLTPAGIEVLRATGVNVRAEAQQTEQAQDEYLYEGDIE